MSKMYNAIKCLCDEKGTNITQMCKEAEVSRGSLTDLKMGRITELSISSTRKIAEFFDVSVDYLLGRQTTQSIMTRWIRLNLTSLYGLKC